MKLSGQESHAYIKRSVKHLRTPLWFSKIPLIVFIITITLLTLFSLVWQWVRIQQYQGYIREREHNTRKLLTIMIPYIKEELQNTVNEMRMRFDSKNLVLHACNVYYTNNDQSLSMIQLPNSPFQHTNLDMFIVKDKQYIILSTSKNNAAEHIDTMLKNNLFLNSPHAFIFNRKYLCCTDNLFADMFLGIIEPIIPKYEYYKSDILIFIILSAFCILMICLVFFTYFHLQNTFINLSTTFDYPNHYFLQLPLIKSKGHGWSGIIVRLMKIFKKSLEEQIRAYDTRYYLGLPPFLRKLYVEIIHRLEKSPISITKEIFFGLCYKEIQIIIKKEYKHYTFSQILYHAQMEKAKYLISKGVKIKDIPVRCGYYDQKYFRKKFRTYVKKYDGLDFSPFEFRNHVWQQSNMKQIHTNKPGLPPGIPGTVWYEKNKIKIPFLFSFITALLISVNIVILKDGMYAVNGKFICNVIVLNIQFFCFFLYFTYFMDSPRLSWFRGRMIPFACLSSASGIFGTLSRFLMHIYSDIPFLVDIYLICEYLFLNYFLIFFLAIITIPKFINLKTKINKSTITCFSVLIFLNFVVSLFYFFKPENEIIPYLFTIFILILIVINQIKNIEYERNKFAQRAVFSTFFAMVIIIILYLIKIGSNIPVFEFTFIKYNVQALFFVLMYVFLFLHSPDKNRPIHDVCLTASLLFSGLLFYFLFETFLSISPNRTWNLIQKTLFIFLALLPFEWRIDKLYHSFYLSRFKQRINQELYLFKHKLKTCLSPVKCLSHLRKWFEQYYPASVLSIWYGNTTGKLIFENVLSDAPDIVQVPDTFFTLKNTSLLDKNCLANHFTWFNPALFSDYCTGFFLNNHMQGLLVLIDPIKKGLNRKDRIIIKSALRKFFIYYRSIEMKRKQSSLLHA